MNYFGYGEQDYIKCEVCASRAVDIHHIKYRSQGGGDNIENIMALCRTCHDKAHSGKAIQPYFQDIHNRFLENFRSYAKA